MVGHKGIIDALASGWAAGLIAFLVAACGAGSPGDDPRAGDSAAAAADVAESTNAGSEATDLRLLEGERRPATARLAAPNDRGIAFNHMHVVVADLAPHEALWPELFGAVMVEKAGYTAASLPGALIFFRQAEPTAASDATVVDHFGLEVTDLSVVIARWQALGHEVDPDDTGTHDDHTVFITMPDGIRLALSENPDLADSAKMGHVHFNTSMHADLVKWYAGRFGAAVQSTGSAGTVAEVPGSLLRFSDSSQQRLPMEGAAIDHVGFEIENWDAFIQALEAENVEFEFGPVYIESLDIRVAFFSDPAGGLVEISHGLDNF